jgi:hypothetical protein
MIVSRKCGEDKQGRRKKQAGLNKRKKKLKRAGGKNKRDKHTKDE